MAERLVFGDLVGLIEPDRSLTIDEDHWLTTLAADVDATDLRSVSERLASARA